MSGSTSYSVFDVANYFISLSQKQMIDDGVPEGITHLKLQKILFFTQAAYLALYKKPLFEDPVLAWKYGPVIERVYHKYKTSGNHPLILEQYDKVIEGNEKLKTFLDGIWELFGKYSANELINISHNHLPWKEAYEKGPSTEITKEKMIEYYKDIFKFQSDENGQV